MANLFFRKPTSEKIQAENPSPSDESLRELRSLLLGPMQEQFQKTEQLVKMLENQELQAEEVSHVLPEAIMLRLSRDKQLVKAMESVTEEAIQSSVARDPRLLVSVLVPVMLPAIRKAIVSLIKEMIQSFSATLEHGLSMRGLKWRYEAFKTKKPFGEVALLHSLIYQVEQVFLIHKDTGLVLQSMVSKESMVFPDPDMVSSMLTAIQDFVRDSFGASQDDGLENLQFGDKSVVIEQTPMVVLAAVVWGNAPVELRDVLRDSLNAIHFENLDNLRSFEGDTDLFETARPHLENCLKSQFISKKKNSFLLWTILGLLIIVIGYWSFFAIRDHIRWNKYLEKLHEEPGIVVTETEKRSGRHYVFGLRDILASDPVDLLKASQIEPDRVRFNWELYHSSHPEFMVRRITKILSPPETVKFELENGILKAKGEAPYSWIVESEKLAEAIPGIIRFEKENIVASEMRQIGLLKENIEKTYFFYDSISTKIKAGQENMSEKLADEIKEMIRLSKIFGQTIHIEIIGHTDSIGTEERNKEISQKRADEFASVLIENGLNEDMFTITGVGATEPLKEELTEQDREFNRCVSFKIILSGVRK